MAKFLDLDSERQRHLIIALRCLEIAVASLTTARGLPKEAARMMLLQQAESDTDSLSDCQIAELLKKLDAAADT